MIAIADTVTIDAPPEVVWSWLESMPDHYLEWHPDHLGATWITGHSLLPGATIEAREILHGRPHRLRMRLVTVEPPRSLTYRVFPGLGGRFDLDRSDGGSEFSATIEIGTRIPVVGPLVDAIVRLLFGRRLEALRRHQSEEGESLARLLASSPDRGPR